MVGETEKKTTRQEGKTEYYIKYLRVLAAKVRKEPQLKNCPVSPRI